MFDEEKSPITGKLRETPDEEDYIRAYLEYSEEARYRDSLIHNSYYFVLIATVIFSGHLLKLTAESIPAFFMKISFALFVASVAFGGICVVISNYNRKRIYAEDQRQVIETILDNHFTESEDETESEDNDFNPRKEDNPFALQQQIVSRNQNLSWDRDRDQNADSITMQQLSWYGKWSGLILGVMSAFLLFISLITFLVVMIVDTPSVF